MFESKNEGIAQGQPSTTARQVLGDPDEQNSRLPGVVIDGNGVVLKNFEAYSVWWYRPVKFCPLCGSIRVTIGADGLVDGVTSQ